MEDLQKVICSLKAHVELELMAGLKETPARSFGSKISKGKSRKDEIQPVRDAALSCKKCELCKTRKNVVFGSGDLNARLMFVGEAPGRDEDEEGLPFVGRAGQLLTKIIESIGLSRDNVYIANVLKCRPPENRNPLPEEVKECEGYLIKQVEVIRPLIICALGKFAAQTLLRSETPISKLRGNFYDYRGIPLMPTYHPAYLLRNPDDKRLVWEDMKKIRKKYNGT